MKKFIIKMSIFISLVAIPLVILSVCYRKTNGYRISNELVNIREFPDQITLLNVGNSREMTGIRYEDSFSGTAHNFATSSQPLYYDLQVLKHAEKNIKKGAVVLLPLSIYDWEYNWREIFKEDKLSMNKRYYGVLNPLHIYNLNFEDYIKCGVIPALTAKDKLKYIYKDYEYKKVYSTYVSTNIKRDVDYAVQAWTQDIVASKEKVDVVVEQNVRDFKKMIDYCLDKGYQPVVISSPISCYFLEAYPAEKLRDFNNITEKVMKDYPDLLYLDYSNDAEISANMKYFKDAIHMNDVGADAFTKKLLERLVQEGYLKKI